jgi:hypothetical protein
MQHFLPFLFLLIFLPFLVIIFPIQLYNQVHYEKYRRLIHHLKRYHPVIYEKIRIKTAFGPFYPSWEFRKSIQYAKNHPPTDDPIAEDLFNEYASYSKISPAIIWETTKKFFGGKLDLKFNKDNIRTGLLIGFLVGVLIGLAVGYFSSSYIIETRSYHFIPPGIFGGVIGGLFFNFRKHVLKMPVIAISLFGSSLGAFNWAIAYLIFLVIFHILGII